ncbi:MAG: glutaredoxin 3 [Pseudomonadota bacterium]
MADILIYTKTGCPYCARAKQLLESKYASYEEIDILEQPDKKAEMISKADGRASVPQIFIDGAHVGGRDDLQAMDEAGKLDALLN